MAILILVNFNIYIAKFETSYEIVKELLLPYLQEQEQPQQQQKHIFIFVIIIVYAYLYIYIYTLHYLVVKYRIRKELFRLFGVTMTTSEYD